MLKARPGGIPIQNAVAVMSIAEILQEFTVEFVTNRWHVR